MPGFAGRFAASELFEIVDIDLRVVTRREAIKVAGHHVRARARVSCSATMGY
jgi:hypothetical protein